MLDSDTRQNEGRIPALQLWVRHSYYTRQFMVKKGTGFKLSPDRIPEDLSGST